MGFKLPLVWLSVGLIVAVLGGPSSIAAELKIYVVTDLEGISGV